MPKYYILSLVYAPPGSLSSNGFTSGTSTGTTSTISSNLAAGESVTVTAGGGSLFGGGSLGATFGLTDSSQDSTAFSDTYTSGQGSQVKAVSDQIDHLQDRFFIWLNPQITVKQTGTSTGTYTLGTPNGQPVDVLDISVAELKNPSLIPAAKLGPQNIHGSILPGLSVLDATDLVTILAEDPPANGTNVACSSRYVYVNSKALEGPDFAGVGDVLNSFNETDAQVTTTTSGVTHAYNTGFTVGGSASIFGLFTLDVKSTTSFSWSNTESAGSSNGTSHQAAITLGTPTVGFLQWIDLYEDTVYHTYALHAPSISPGCTAAQAVVPGSGQASPAPVTALKGTVSTSAGAPASNQLVVVHLSDGTVRNIYTDPHGAYLLYSGPSGLVDVTVGNTLLHTSIFPNHTTVADVVIP
jgi:hypothetical protein